MLNFCFRNTLLSTRDITALLKVIAIWLLLFVCAPVHSEALLQILPTRVVLDDSTRLTSLTLVNQGDEDTSYRMFFRNIRMSETGQFNILTEEDDVSDEKFADNMLRFSPRRITIPARGKQTIRIVARKPPGLEKGEYRSHMVFRRLPPQTSVLDRAENPELQLAIRPVVEVTIPVIVRHEKPDANVTLSDIQLTKDTEYNPSTNAEELQTVINIAINRKGDRSLYGDLDIHWTPKDGEKVKVGEANGISVYYPNKKRIFGLPLQLHNIDGSSEPLNLSNGKLSATFEENPIYGGDQSSSISIVR